MIGIKTINIAAMIAFIEATSLPPVELSESEASWECGIVQKRMGEHIENYFNAMTSSMEEQVIAWEKLRSVERYYNECKNRGYIVTSINE